MKARTRGLSLFAVIAAIALGACAGATQQTPTPVASSATAVTPPSSAAPSSSAAPPLVNADPSALTDAQRARDAALAPKAAAFVDAFGNYGAVLAQGDAFAFVSTRNGLPQIFVGDAAHPSAPARKLATPAERAILDTILPDGKTILFRSDVGADGNFHVFKIGIDGSGLADLTPGEVLHRNAPLVARDARGVFAYSAHATKSETTRVFLQTSDSAPREIYSNPRGGFLMSIAADASRVLFAEIRSDDDVVLWDVDAKTSAARRVFPAEGAVARVHAASYALGASRVLVATQTVGKPSELVALDRTTGKLLARYEESIAPSGALNGMLVHDKTARVVISVNAGNHSELRVLGARRLELERTLDTGLATAFAEDFSPDGARFTVTLSRADTPPDVYAADAKTGAMKRLRDDPRPGFADLPPLATTIAKVRAFDGLEIPMNLHLPPTTAAKMPTIVLVHGGPTGSAFVRWSSEVRFWSAMGYAVIEPNIRGSSGFGVAYERADDKEKRGDALKDVETVNRWARTQPWCDADRMIVMGTSYGGYMTLLALTRQPALWAGGVDLSGMSDLRTMEKLEDQAIRVFDETEFGALGKDDAVLLEWSPLKDAANIAAPLFVYQGKNDPVTPQNEADQIVRALRARNVPVEYMLVANEGHGIVRRENRVEFYARAARFLEEHTKQRAAR